MSVRDRLQKLEKLLGSDSAEPDTLDRFILTVCRRNIDEESGLELILDCHVELMRRHDPEYYAKYKMITKNDAEIIIEAGEIEKLGDISGFTDFDPENDFPLYVDKHGVENKDRVRLYYGSEYWTDLTKNLPDR